MINLKNLWIGDKVKVLSNNNVGCYEGIDHNGMAKIKIGNTIHLHAQQELEVYTEENITQPDLDFLNEDAQVLTETNKLNFKLRTEIDLHIQVLSPENMNSHPAVIIDLQIEALQKFVQQALSQNLKTITIIHGKGEGKLKEYVHQYLSGIPQTKWKVLTNKEGATEAWFEYL